MASIANLRDIVDALVASAEKKQKLEKVTNDLESFFDLLTRSRELRTSLTNTVFNEEERCMIVTDICKEAGFDDITRNFIVLTVEFNSFNEMFAKRALVIDRLKKAAGKIRAHIKTAASLSDSELERIKKVITGSTGKDVELSTEVDPSLIAGMFARVENKVFDSSVKSRLGKIKSVLASGQKI